MLRVLELLITAIAVITVVRGVIRILSSALGGFVSSQMNNSPQSGPQAPPRTGGPPEALRKDPVCGTFVAASTAFQKSKGGQTYFFCSAACRDKF